MRAGFSSRLTIRVEVARSVPPIWRVFTCPSDIRLDQLHRVLQTVVGWTDSHLHQFIPERVPGRPEVVFFDPGDEFAEDDEGAVPESEVRVDRVLSQVGDTLGYLYDFGDHWEHILTMEAVTDRDPTDRAVRCVGGERAAPVEDVGGIDRYNELMDPVRAPDAWRDPDVAELLDVLGLFHRPDAIDLDWINDTLTREAHAADALEVFLSAGRSGAASVVLASILARAREPGRLFIARYLFDANPGSDLVLTREVAERGTRVIRALLDRVGEDGVVLTAAGYLPPVVVADLLQVADPEGRWIGDHSREINVPPVQALREVTTTLGLTRKAKGVFRLTAAGEKLRRDPASLWAHVASRLPIEQPAAVKDIGALGLLLIAAGLTPGSDRFTEELDTLVSVAGWQLRSGTDPAYLFHHARQTRHLLHWAGTGTLIDATIGDDDDVPAGMVLLARSALTR